MLKSPLWKSDNASITVVEVRQHQETPHIGRGLVLTRGLGVCTLIIGQVRSGHCGRYVTRPKSEAMRVSRQLRLPPIERAEPRRSDSESVSPLIDRI